MQTLASISNFGTFAGMVNQQAGIRAKKHLGQHFLKDENIARKIVDAFVTANPCKQVIEVGPGTGVLTKYLVEFPIQLYAWDIDKEAVDHLMRNLKAENLQVSYSDFLEADLPETKDAIAVIGNFPYNISSQIVFRILDDKERIPYMVGMFQREMAQRIAAKPGGKDYGIISVLTQAWYKVEYLFTVNEGVFNPPPKVKSGVIRMTRKEPELPINNEVRFKQVVKTAFQQRRKMLRNSLDQLYSGHVPDNYATLRPEQLSVQDFIQLANVLQA